MLYLAFLLHVMNYLELLESIYWTASWKVQDKRGKENNLSFLFSSPTEHLGTFPPGSLGPLSYALLLQQSSHSC